MLDIIESAWGKLVYADTVMVMVDDAAEGSDQAGFVDIAADYFEDGFLHPMAVGLADLGDAAQTATACGGSGLDVVGDQEIHVR